MSIAHSGIVEPLAKRAKRAAVTLICSDGVRIEVEDQVVASLHGLRHSIGSLTRSAEEAVEVPEPSKVIQQVLACLRADRPPPKPNVHDDSLWPVYKALWKYEIRLGSEAAVNAWTAALRAHPHELPTVLRCYLFAGNYHPPLLAPAVARLIALNLPPQDVANFLQEAQAASNLSDGGRLVRLLTQRSQSLLLARERLLLSAADLIAREPAESLPRSAVAQLFRVWQGSSACLTAEAVVEYRGKYAVGIYRDLLPWTALIQAAMVLPTKLPS